MDTNVLEQGSKRSLPNQENQTNLVHGNWSDLLTFEELKDVVLGIECFLNSPLCYQEEEFEKPVIAKIVWSKDSTRQILG